MSILKTKQLQILHLHPNSCPKIPVPKESEQGGVLRLWMCLMQNLRPVHSHVSLVAFSSHPEVDEATRFKPVHGVSSDQCGSAPKQQRVDADSVIAPKAKAAKTESTIRQVCQVEVCHSDEIPLEEQIGYDFDALDEDTGETSFSWEEQEELSKEEGEGPPEISDEAMKELEASAALDELKKFQDIGVIES